MYKKRGQATILILLGILVVGLVGGVYYTRDYVFKSKLERMSEKSLVVPSQAEGVRDYVMSCIRDVSEEAVDLAGQRGGYIEIPKDNIPPSIYNKFSNSLEVLPGFEVPYWYYKQANNVDKQQILSLEQIGNNIAHYIDEQLRVCVGSFDGFKGYKINPGMIKTDVEVQNSRVLFEINFPLHMEIKDFEFDFRNFYYKLDKPLGELYDIARGIYNYENGKNFLEEKTIDMMVGYDEIPLTGENFECGFVAIWDKYSVIENFKKVLGYNIPIIKIKGTEHGLTEDEKKYYEVDIGSVKDVDINFVYSGRWPFYLDVTPEENGILKAESLSDGLGGKLKGVVESFVCYMYWHFVYDIKYPVLVILNKDDYNFQFATMVVIDRNEPRQNILEPMKIPEVDVRFCDNKQFDIEVSVFDSDGVPVNEVDVSYKCINHLCNLGKTTGNYFSGKVMPCGGGSVLTNKQGYHFGEAKIDTLSDASISVNMKKLYELDADVEVLRGGAGNIREDEKVYINLMNKEDDYSVNIIYPDNQKIKLIEGNYDVSLFMMKDGEIEIPAREVRTCIDVPKKILGVIGQTEEKCVTSKIPSIEIGRVITGGSEFSMFVSRSDLLKNKIVFYVPYEGIPKTHEDLYKIKTEVEKYPKFV